jgi:hypothetical protein
MNELLKLLEYFEANETWPGSGQVEVSKEEHELAKSVGLKTEYSSAYCGDGYEPGDPERFYIRFRDEQD